MASSSGTLYPYPRRRRPVTGYTSGGHTYAPVAPPAWTQPTSAPPGTYDPNLDFQGENNTLGLGFEQGGLLGSSGAYQPYVLGDDGKYHPDSSQPGIGYSDPGSLAGLDTSYTNNVEQARRNYSQTNEGLTTALTRAEQDYGTQTSALGKTYRDLAANQTDRARGAGAAQGGALEQALAKRTANQGTQQSALDTALARTRENIGTARSRNEETWRTLVGADEHGGTLGAAHDAQRGGLLANASRGESAYDLFAGGGGQLDRAKVYSAKDAGLLPLPPYGAAGTYDGVAYEPDPVYGGLRPKGKPTALSVLMSGSLAGTGMDSRTWRRRR